MKKFVRFCIVGVIATAIHYAIYYALQTLGNSQVWLTAAYTIGYGLSMVCNFFLTTWFTFRSKVSIGKLAGFGGSHAINYSLQIVLFNAFISLGVNHVVVPFMVYAIAVPTNFMILRLVYKRRE